MGIVNEVGTDVRRSRQVIANGHEHGAPLVLSTSANSANAELREEAA